MNPVWRVARPVLLVVVVAALAYCGWFRLSGGVWERVESPSMGTTAPVGSLLWVRPVEAGSLEPGNFVTFHRPDGSGQVYSHRVTDVDPDGTFTTAGDLSGADPWQVPPDHLVGRVDRVWPGVGRLVEAFPLLLLGGLVTGGAARLLRRRRRDDHGARTAVPLLGASVTLAVAMVVYAPLVDAEQLGFAEIDGGAEATYVSTGLLPIALVAPGEHRVVLGPGEDGSVTVTRAVDHALSVDLEPAIPLWFWYLLVAACFAPALLTRSDAGGVEVTAPDRPNGQTVSADRVIQPAG